MIHTEKHQAAGKVVLIKDTVGPDTNGQVLAGQEYHIEDWWDRVGGQSWMVTKNNPACMLYAMRSGLADLPCDNEVVYGKIGGLGHLIHVSELDFDSEPIPA